MQSTMGAGNNKSTLIEKELKQLEKIKFKQVILNFIIAKRNLADYSIWNENGIN